MDSSDAYSQQSSGLLSDTGCDATGRTVVATLFVTPNTSTLSSLRDDNQQNTRTLGRIAEVRSQPSFCLRNALPHSGGIAFQLIPGDSVDAEVT
jgi:hypothetical protein